MALQKNMFKVVSWIWLSFMLVLLAFTFPVMGIVNTRATVAGLPVLFVYIFVVWTLFTLLMVLIAKYRLR